MVPGPVFNVELLTTARRLRYYVLRLIYGLVLLIVVLQNYQFRRSMSGGWISARQMSSFAASVFYSFAVVQALVVLTFTPALVAGVIANERQRKTLHYLLASRLSSAEIVLGKLCARMLHVGVFLAVGFPIVSLLSLLGGIEPLLIVLVYAATLTTGFFLAAMAVLVSTVAIRVRDAITAVYTFEVAWLFLPTLIKSQMARDWPRIYDIVGPVNEWFVASGPVDFVSGFNFFRASSSTITEAVLWMMGLQVAYGVVFATLAVWWLRPVFRRLEGRVPRRGRVVRFFRRPAIGDDAMLWKERHTSTATVPSRVIGAIIVLGLLTLLTYWTIRYGLPASAEFASDGYSLRGGGTNARREFNAFLRTSCTVAFSIAMLATATAAANGFTSEREEDTWSSLIATPLDSWEIVRAKMIGAVWRVRGLFVVVLVLGLIGVLCGSVHPIGVIVFVLGAGVFVWFSTALGTYLSLASRSTWRAQTGVIGFLLALNGGYLFCLLPIICGTGFTLLYGMGCTPFIEASTLVAPWEVRRVLDGSWPEGPGGSSVEMVATCMFGLFGYGGSAWAVTRACVGRFEEVADRPHKPRFESMTAGDPRGYEPKESTTMPESS
jgi:ABC-type transport system involved in multi-copper enzyme maturation permease subunit